MMNGNTYLLAAKPAIIQDQLIAYEVSWQCDQGHINFQTILGKTGIQHDVCLQCGKHYAYTVLAIAR